MKSKDIFADFQLDETTGLAHRYAAILLYALEKHPGEVLSRPLMFKIANKRAVMPPANSREVRGMTSAISRAKIILRKKYSKALLSVNGGYRLATDNDDWLLRAMPPAMTRFESGRALLVEVSALGDVSKVSAHLSVQKAAHRQLMTNVLKQIRDPSFQKSLMLPQPMLPVKSSV